MSNEHYDLIINETIKWLNDIGCDEVLNSDKRKFYGLISNDKNFKDKKNDVKNVQNFNFEDIDNIKSLKQFLLSKTTNLNINTFPHGGDENADLMVIGDTPEDNINSDIPFQGEEGKLLDAMLNAIGYDKSNTYYTNIYNISDKIDKNIINKVIKKQISIIHPKVIIMFGAEATKLITNMDDSIFHTRGKWYDIKVDNTNNFIPGISMFHPRYILANSESKKETWGDLKAVRQKLT